MHEQYLPNRQDSSQDSMRENNNIAGTKLQVHKTRKQKAVSQHTTAHLATFKPESQLFMSCEKFPYRRGSYTQSVKDDVMCRTKSTPDPTSCGRHSLRPSMYTKAGCLIRKQGTVIRSVIPLSYLITRSLYFAFSKLDRRQSITDPIISLVGLPSRLRVSIQSQSYHE